MNKPGIHFSIFVVTALGLLGTVAGSVPLQPGDSWTVELLPESARILDLDGEVSIPSDPVQSPSGTPTEQNRMGRDFREIRTGGQGGVPARLLLLTSDFYLEEVDAPAGFVMDTLHEEMPGGRMIWNRLTEFAWVSPQNLVGRIVLDGVECEIHAEFEDDNERLIHLAAISVEDGRPLRLESRGEVRRYVWSRGPAATMPAAALAVLEEYRVQIQRQIQRHNVPR